jgi:hypothetical protein
MLQERPPPVKFGLALRSGALYKRGVKIPFRLITPAWMVAASFGLLDATTGQCHSGPGPELPKLTPEESRSLEEEAALSLLLSLEPQTQRLLDSARKSPLTIRLDPEQGVCLKLLNPEAGPKTLTIRSGTCLRRILSSMDHTLLTLAGAHLGWIDPSGYAVDPEFITQNVSAQRLRRLARYPNLHHPNCRLRLFRQNYPAKGLLRSILRRKGYQLLGPTADQEPQSSILELVHLEEGRIALSANGYRIYRHRDPSPSDQKFRVFELLRADARLPEAHPTEVGPTPESFLRTMRELLALPQCKVLFPIEP